MKRYVRVGICAALLTGSVSAQDLTPPLHGDWGVDLSDQDRSIRPGDNFAMYQSGQWFARTELRSASATAAYWRDVRLLASRQLGAILATLADDRAAPPGTARGKAGAFYRAAMNAADADAKGIAPLEPSLGAIRAATDRTQLARLIGATEGPGTLRVPSARLVPGRGMFSLAIGQDQGDPGRYAVHIGQGGLMLPGPEYYADPSLADVLPVYRAHIATMLGLIHWPEPERRAAEIIALETRIAAVSWSHEQMRDPVKTYNPRTVAALARSAPGFDWRGFLSGAGLGKVTRVVVDAPDATAKIAAIYAETPLAVLQARQAFADAEIDAPRLNAALHAESAAFQRKVMQGLQQDPDRALEAEKWLEACMPDALSALYVARFSSPAIKARAEEMAVGMKAVLDTRLQQSPWLSPPGRAKAREKLARMRFHIGYPDSFDDYADVTVSDSDFYGDVSRAAAAAWRRSVAQLDRPFDRAAWALTPIYPQYGYVFATNTVEIPAALMLPPFFDPRADDAVNYGAVGTVIASMIVNAFGGGIDYDAEGRLRPWLTADETHRYAALRSALAAHYSLEEPLPGIHIKGELVADEAVNDLGAVRIALDAYHAALHGAPAPMRDGYSGDQRFFLGRAQMWRAKFGPDFLRNQLATGSNAPPYMRINGPLPQIDEWYAAFEVKPGDKLYVAPDARIRLW